MYGLKQATWACYSKLDSYLLKCSCGFKRGTTNSNLYVKYNDDKLLRVVTYVDDIFFPNDLYSLTSQFAADMKAEFEYLRKRLGVVPFNSLH